MQIYMTATDYECLYSSSYEEALDAVNSNTIDLFFVDISMPGKDGFDVIKELKVKNINTNHIFALTGYSTEAEKKKILDAGFKDLIIKPVTKKVLIKFIEENSVEFENVV
jgi:DNA-binding response OmpR family regulator